MGAFHSGHAPGADACVAILLSTFNGEPYLREQLRGFQAQTHANWRLYWRDDGSRDGSGAVMRAFSEGAGAERCVRHPREGRLKATASFLALLHAALRGTAAYFAFSDQDDVWLPGKLAHGVAALERVPAGQPALYFCPRIPVDAALHPRGEALAPRRAPGFPAALTQNVIPGCCMVLNRAAAERIDACPVPEGTWHDWWSYLVVAASGGTIIAGETPDILYRQHARNLVGEPRGFWHRIAGAVRRGRSPFMDLLWGHVRSLRACPHPLPERTNHLLMLIERARDGGPPARLRALCIPRFARQTPIETLLFRLLFLLG